MAEVNLVKLLDAGQVVAVDAPVIKHQAISVNDTDQALVVPE